VVQTSFIVGTAVADAVMSILLLSRMSFEWKRFFSAGVEIPDGEARVYARPNIIGGNIKQFCSARLKRALVEQPRKGTRKTAWLLLLSKHGKQRRTAFMSVVFVIDPPS
jgi:hypothetical protein